MNYNSKIEFLKCSIQDIQGTIRSIDNKIFGVLVLLILPVTILDRLEILFCNLSLFNSTFAKSLLIAFFGCWILSLIFSFRAVLSIGNPNNFINGNTGKGYFYGSNLFSINIFGNLFSRQTSLKSLESYLEEMKSDWEIVNELTYEQMKLVYIREFKMKMQKIALMTLALSILIVLTSWLIVVLFL